MGKKWLQHHKFTSEEFSILKSWSGWATIDSRSHNDKADHSDSVNIQNDTGRNDKILSSSQISDVGTTGRYRPQGISREQMIVLGKQVKCIIDYGRAEYLKTELGFRDVVYTQYCDSNLTCECRLLCAKR